MLIALCVIHNWLVFFPPSPKVEQFACDLWMWLVECIHNGCSGSRWHTLRLPLKTNLEGCEEVGFVGWNMHMSWLCCIQAIQICPSKYKIFSKHGSRRKEQVEEIEGEEGEGCLIVVWKVWVWDCVSTDVSVIWCLQNFLSCLQNFLSCLQNWNKKVSGWDAVYFEAIFHHLLVFAHWLHLKDMLFFPFWKCLTYACLCVAVILNIDSFCDERISICWSVNTCIM